MRYEVRDRNGGRGIWDTKVGRWANGTVYHDTRKLNRDARSLEMKNLDKGK